MRWNKRSKSYDTFMGGMIRPGIRTSPKIFHNTNLFSTTFSQVQASSRSMCHNIASNWFFGICGKHSCSINLCDDLKSYRFKHLFNVLIELIFGFYVITSWMEKIVWIPGLLPWQLLQIHLLTSRAFSRIWPNAFVYSLAHLFLNNLFDTTLWHCLSIKCR